MAAQACLQVGHQQRGCDPFAGNVSYDQRNAFSAEIEKIIVVSAYRPGLKANTGVIEPRDGRQRLRKQSRLHLLGDLQLLGGTALLFKPLGLRPPAFFYRSGYIVEARQDEEVAVYIFKT
jgi:hypothetical protein